MTSDGVLHLRLDTYNPTGPGNSFLGSEVISKQSFTTSAGGIAFEASARIASPAPGFVGGLFGFNFHTATGLHSELDFELLSNDAAAGRTQVQTNVYGNEPLGAGHPLFVPVTDLTSFHTYRMEWFPDRMRWLVDNQLVREITDHIPQGALALHLNIWAPAADWMEAYSPLLQPTSNPALNVPYYVDVKSVRVAALGILEPVLCCKDFNADGRDDILWRNTISGQVYEWLMNGTSVIGQGSPGTVSNDCPDGWRISGVGDFNGDGRADILWRNPDSGEVNIWLMNGTTPIGGGSPGTVTDDWQIAGVGDFNGDGKADILWRNTISGEVNVWLINGTGIIGGGSLGTVAHDWQIAGVGDFNGDGKADILWRNVTSGEVVIWLMNGTSVIGGGSVGSATNDWQIAGVGDFNGDGKADILWRHTSGEVYEWLINGTTVTGQGSTGSATNDWKIAGVGDFNGDGKADILWRHTSGLVYEWLINGTTVTGQGSTGSATNDWHIE